MEDRAIESFDQIFFSILLWSDSNCLSVGRRQKTVAFDAVFGVIPIPRSWYVTEIMSDHSIYLGISGFMYMRGAVLASNAICDGLPVG
jgi:hypothetical protein